MGIPIKERGIRWKENYGDKSAYLKEEYEKQVGPGSYFRWEGHDHSTGTDYYVVVTPGYSEKHGYHFFAALRKMAGDDQGASGKKFKNQAEALSHAFETWRVPPPDTKPHKPYIDKDLVGKPIVLENVHASVEDAMVKEGMAFMTSAPAGNVVKNYGPKEYAADLRQAAAMNMIMAPGAALYTSKQWQVIDKYDQKGNVFSPEGGAVSGIHTGLATAQPPSEALWNAVMNPAGIPTEKRLLKVDRKAGTVEVTPPRIPDAKNSPNYQLIRFNNIMNITPTFRIGFDRKPAFDQLVKSVQADPTFKSKLSPQDSLTVMNEAAPAKRGNYSVTLSIPVDLFKRFQASLDTGKLASVEKLRWEDDNAIELYSHFLKNGQLETPEQIEQAKQTPVVEVSRPVQGQLIVYGPGGWPIGIKVKQSRKYDQEAGDESDEVSDVMLPFRKGQVENLLGQANGDLKTLRSMLANNKIPLQREMFADARTCAPKNRQIWGMMPDLDENAIPRQDPSGQLVLKRRSLIDPYQMDAPGGKVRVFNPETNREELQDLPADVNPTQVVNGIPLVMKGAKYYIPVQKAGPNGEVVEDWHEIDSGETRIYDTESAGRFKNGAVFTVYAKPEKSSSKKSNIKDIHGKGQDSLGFFAGHKKTLSDLTYREAASVWDRHLPSLHSIITPNGQELEFPENPDASPDDPAVQYLKSKQPITGYFYIVPRQYAPIPFTSSANPVIERRKKNEEGVFGPEIDPATGQPMPPLRIEDPDVSTVYKGVTYLNRMETAIKIIKAAMGWDDETIGRWTNATIEDLHAADDKVREVDGILAGQNTGEGQDNTLLSLLKPGTPEAIFAEFEKKGNEIPLVALQEFSQITDDPKFFMPRKGTLYQIMQKDPATGQVSEANDHLFVTADRASQFMALMTSRGEGQGELFVSNIDNADLMISAFRQTKQDPSAQSVVTNGVSPQAPEAEAPAGPEAPGEISEAIPTGNVAPIAPPEEEIIPGGEEFPITGPATPEVPTMPTEAVPAMSFQLPAEKPTIQFQPQGPMTQAPEPAPMSFQLPPEQPPQAPPLSFQIRPRPQASSINKLVQFANRLDEQGKFAEADAIDKIIKMSIERGDENAH